MKKTLFVFSFALLLVGCQTDPEAAKTTQQQPQFGQPVSTIPWNRPEDWENGGQLGGMMPNGAAGQVGGMGSSR
jgi:starvation-inducible outer membrane lipoprotein